MSLPVVAVVGRPNVGKSTLFNRLVGFQKAVVHDRAGVTRDRLYEEAEILDHRVLLVDTGGIEPESAEDLLASMRRQSLIAVEEATVIVFVVDGKMGLVPADIEVADILRRSSKPVVVAVNKIDGPGQEDLATDFWQLGLPELLTISAAHGRGMYELADAVLRSLPPAPDVEELEPGTPIEQAEDEGGPIRIAVVGRPNIGKSTLVNALLGENRHVVDDRPGTTMDPIDSALTVDGRDYVLVDTAGVRKKARIDDALERFVSLRAIRSIERCHVTVLMIDGTEGVTEQDAKLAELVIDRGRAVVILVNKWDLARGNEDLSAKAVMHDIDQKLPHVTWAPKLFISAKTGRGIHRVLPAITKVYEQFDKRIPTPQLNNFLQAAIHAHTPPQRHHHPVRLYYVAQTRVRPPTFTFFSNTPEGIGPAYRRYLQNRMREEFGFEGTPLKAHFRKRRKAGEDDEKQGKA
ncbi:MAG: ribosome biogenesis GTPase Der [Myxococcales bacterium]|nr:ribosome biogenesis GTPase Der [Myxococcales bacterium]